MKIVLIMMMLILPVAGLLADDESSYSSADAEYNIPPPEQIDWSKTHPLDFLDMLRERPNMPVVIGIKNKPPEGWMDLECIAKLMTLINSNEPAAPVVAELGSYYPKGRQSTVGNEAMFLIDGYRKGVYPSAMCSVYDFNANPKELKIWWQEQNK